MPASIASSRCWAMSWVKIGVSASSPITTPAWRAEIVQPPCSACGARPCRAVSVSAESTSARPMPTRIWGGMRQHDLAFGSSARPPRPPATRIAPAAARVLRARHRGADPPADEGEERHHRDDDRRADRRHPPAFDQQQDEQEERGGDRRRDQRQGEVGEQVRAAGAAQLGLDDPGRRLVPGDGEDRHRGDDRDRDLDEEDRLPGDQLGEHAADRRPERGAGRARPSPRSPSPGARSRPSPAAARAPRSPPARRPAPARSGPRSAC